MTVWRFSTLSTIWNCLWLTTRSQFLGRQRGQRQQMDTTNHFTPCTCAWDNNYDNCESRGTYLIPASKPHRPIQSLWIWTKNYWNNWCSNGSQCIIHTFDMQLPYLAYHIYSEKGKFFTNEHRGHSISKWSQFFNHFVSTFIEGRHQIL